MILRNYGYFLGRKLWLFCKKYKNSKEKRVEPLKILCLFQWFCICSKKKKKPTFQAIVLPLKEISLFHVIFYSPTSPAPQFDHLPFPGSRFWIASYSSKPNQAHSCLHSAVLPILSRRPYNSSANWFTSHLVHMGKLCSLRISICPKSPHE